MEYGHTLVCLINWQYTDLEIQLLFVNCAVFTRLGKNFEHLFFPSQVWYKATLVCWCKQLTSKSFQMSLYCIDLLKLYYKSTIIMLTNILNKIWSEISKIDWFFEWFIVTVWKGWRKLNSWAEINVLCIVDQDHQRWVITLDHTSKFEAIYSVSSPASMGKTWKMEQHLRNYQINHNFLEKGRKYYCWKLRESKVKTYHFFRNYLSKLARILNTIRAGRARAWYGKCLRVGHVYK